MLMVIIPHIVTLAKAKNTLCKTQIETQLSKVANWQVNNFTYQETGNLHDYGIDSWTNSVLYIGLWEWAIVSEDIATQKWLENIGSKNNWKIPANFKNYPKYQLYHADELCIAQFYLNAYSTLNDSSIITPTIERINWIMNNPQNLDMSHSNKQSWTWCDALFMAPPVYSKLAQLTKNKSYLDFMDKHFRNTYNHLYDKNENLFFRDDSYFNKTEANGKNIFWGRGNGWVAAGLVNILKTIPLDSELRPFYEEIFSELITKLVSLQSKDGFWHASLLDTSSYPAPETSATALITYALAYGINNNILEPKKFLPATTKAWNALTSVIDNNGKLGFVQPIGADPKKVTKDMTAVYGVGAFLLAGTELIKLTETPIKI